MRKTFWYEFFAWDYLGIGYYEDFGKNKKKVNI